MWVAPDGDEHLSFGGKGTWLTLLVVGDGWCWAETALKGMYELRYRHHKRELRIVAKFFLLILKQFKRTNYILLPLKSSKMISNGRKNVCI